MSLNHNARRFATLAQRKTQLDDELKDVKQQMTAMTDLLMTAFTEEGIKKVTVVTKGEVPIDMIVSIGSQIWPKFKNGLGKEDVIKALGEMGSDHLVTKTYNANALAAMVREFERDDAGKPKLPPELDAVIDAVEIFKAKATKA